MIEVRVTAKRLSKLQEGVDKVILDLAGAKTISLGKLKRALSTVVVEAFTTRAVKTKVAKRPARRVAKRKAA